MRLGLGLPLASSAEELRDQAALAVAADGLGFDIVWAAEGYGADAVSLLATIAARTEHIRIGSAVLQIPGRSPAMTAMTAAGLDSLSQGRFHLGLGVSGPQVSEGWHGVAFADPLGRTEEYVHIVRQALARHRVTAGGKHFTLPLPNGDGKALALALRPERTDIPIYLAAVGPKNLALAGRIADGWLGIFVDRQAVSGLVSSVVAAAQAADRDPATLDMVAQVPVSLGVDRADAEARLRPYAALYIGGMGSKKTNFYHRIATAMGFEAEADLVQERFLSRDYQGAAAAVPAEFLARTCLIGTDPEVAAGMEQLRDAGVTTLSVSPLNLPLEDQIRALERVVRIAEEAGVRTS